MLPRRVVKSVRLKTAPCITAVAAAVPATTIETPALGTAFLHAFAPVLLVPQLLLRGVLFRNFVERSALVPRAVSTPALPGLAAAAAAAGNGSGSGSGVACLNVASVLAQPALRDALVLAVHQSSVATRTIAHQSLFLQSAPRKSAWEPRKGRLLLLLHTRSGVRGRLRLEAVAWFRLVAASCVCVRVLVCVRTKK